MRIPEDPFAPHSCLLLMVASPLQGFGAYSGLSTSHGGLNREALGPWDAAEVTASRQQKQVVWLGHRSLTSAVLTTLAC